MDPLTVNIICGCAGVVVGFVLGHVVIRRK